MSLSAPGNNCGKRLTRRKIITLAGIIAFCYPLFQFISFRLAKKPVYVNVNSPVSASGFLMTNDFVLFDRNGKCWALSRKCTHLGCKLNYHEQRDILECPCHQSQFTPDTGSVVRGPAKRNLTFLPVEKRIRDPLYVVTT